MSSHSSIYDELDGKFPGILLRDHPLASHTTLRIGGPADRFVCVEDASLLAELLGAAREMGIPSFLLGGGSNLLIDDAGIRGLVIQVGLRERSYDGSRIRVEAGFGFHDLIVESVDRDCSGLEFAAGIPGTVGGAVWGNAGCYGQAIGDFMVEGRWIDPRGRISTVAPDAFGFSYRDSELKRNGCVLVDILLELEPGDRARSQSIIDENLGLRHRKHPQSEPCAGSYFKNVPPPDPDARRIPAGKLLEEVGAKDLRVGGAAVFAKHANIIINAGDATAGEVLALAAEMKRRVHERFGVLLEEEVTYVPADLSFPSRSEND